MEKKEMQLNEEIPLDIYLDDKNHPLQNLDNTKNLREKAEEDNAENVNRKIQKFLNSDKESFFLIKFMKKIKKNLMNFLGNIKQNIDFYVIIKEKIRIILMKIEEMMVLLNKVLLNLKTKTFGSLTENNIVEILNCFLEIGDLLIYMFETPSNNIFLKSGIAFFYNIYKSFINLKSEKSKLLISAILHEKLMDVVEKIINYKIEYIDKYQDAFLNVKMIKVIKKCLNIISIRNDSIIDYEILYKNNKIPKILDLFKYLFISQSNIFSLGVYSFFENFSNIFYKIMKKIINISKKFYLNKNFEEIKSILNINLHKLNEISKMKEDLKNNIDESHNEFYLDNLILQIKITKLIVKNYFKFEILNDDNIRDKICKFLIEISFWDNLDIVDNSCKFFVLLWNISTKHKVFMRSDIEKIIDYLFLRRFKEFFSILKESQELIKLSVLEILINYLNILLREYNFLFLIYLNYDFCKVRFNILSEILSNLQKYFELNDPNFNHLKSSIIDLYLNIFEILNDVFINGNINNNILHDNYLTSKKNLNEEELFKKNISEKKFLFKKNVQKAERNKINLIQNTIPRNKMIFASDNEEKIIQHEINVGNESSKHSADYTIGESGFSSEYSEIDEEKTKNKKNNNTNLDIIEENQNDKENKKHKFAIDFDFIKEIEHLQDLWNYEIIYMINSNNSSFKKFNNKICPLFGLKPIETVHKKKAKQESELENETKSNDISKTDSFNSSTSNDSFVMLDMNNSTIVSTEEKGSENYFSNSNEKNISDSTNIIINQTPKEPILEQSLNAIKNKESDNSTYKNNYRKIAYAIAVMIKYSYYIDVEKLHEIFGNKNEFSKMIFQEYLNTFDFRGLDILKAFRILSCTFRLTGESDNLYNMIMCFSEKYFNDNPHDENLRSVDEVCTLAYSILMLNTDLHDPKVRDHMTIEDFPKNIYATRMFDHISKSYLESIYRSISQYEFPVPANRMNDYVKKDEVYDILRMKRNLLKNMIFFYEANKGNDSVNENFISDFEKENVIRFVFEILTCGFNEKNCQKEYEDFLDVPKMKRSLNFVLLNLCENFNTNETSIEEYMNHDGNKNKNEITQIHQNKILSSIYYLLWEDVFYNFMGISRKFYEIKDDNINKIFDKICMISDALNKKENIDKLIMTVHSLINSENYEKKNLPQLYNIFFSISINYSKNFNSYLEIYFSSILEIIKHKIYKNESDLQEDYKSIIENQIQKSFSVINNKKNKKSSNNGLFGYLFNRSKDTNDTGLMKYRENILDHLKISEAIYHSDKFDEEFFELKKIFEIIRNQDEEFIFFVSLAASKILDYNSKAEHYFSLIFINEILNENLNEKEFVKIWQNLFNIFVNKMEFKHIFDKEENLFEILFFDSIFTLIIKRFSHLIETEDYIQLLTIYCEVENYDILYYFIENNDLIHINHHNLIDSEKMNVFENEENSSNSQNTMKRKEKNNIKNKYKNNILLNFNNKLIKKDQSIELNILLIYKLITHFSQSFQNNKSEIIFLEKLKECFKFLYRVISNIKDFKDLTLDSLSYIHSIFKLLQENNFVCVFISQKPENNERFYLVVEVIIPKLIVSLPSIDDQKWHFYLSILNTLINTLLIEDNNIQKQSFNNLKKLFADVKIPVMIIKDVFNILASYYNGLRLVNFKHEFFWEDLFNIFNSLIKANEDIINNEYEMTRLWQIYIKGFMDNYRQTEKKSNNGDINPKLIIKETLNFVYDRVKSMDKSPNWWEVNKNFIRLYFSDLLLTFN